MSTSTLTSRVVTVRCGGPGLVIPNKRSLVRQGVLFTEYDNRKNMEPPRAFYNQGFAETPRTDVVLYVHDDVTIHDSDWHKRVMLPFTSDDVVAVGLGGAIQLGHRDLYKRPYRLPDMARAGYASNQTDWEVHGQRTMNVHQAAVLDAFFMAVRTSFLRSIHIVCPWPLELTHHVLDLWLACEAARRKKRTYAVGVSCTHHGGRTSTKGVYAKAKWLQGHSIDSDHTEPHRWLYEQYRDVLPIIQLP